jgi:hypothetical protein
MSRIFSSKGKCLAFFFGLICLVLGYFLLVFTDPMGQNIFSIISPILIVGSLVAIFISFLPGNVKGEKDE